MTQSYAQPGKAQKMPSYRKASDVVPGDCRHFHHSLAERRGVRHPEREAEVVHADGHGVEHLRIDRFLLFLATSSESGKEAHKAMEKTKHRETHIAAEKTKIHLHLLHHRMVIPND